MVIRLCELFASAEIMYNSIRIRSCATEYMYSVADDDGGQLGDKGGRVRVKCAIPKRARRVAALGHHHGTLLSEELFCRAPWRSVYSITVVSYTDGQQPNYIFKFMYSIGLVLPQTSDLRLQY